MCIRDSTDFICTESQREQTNLFFFLKFNLSHKLQLLDVQHNFCSVMCYTVIIGTLILLTRCMECSALIKSALPSDTRVNCDKTRERSVQVFISYERSFSLVFWEEEWLVGATSSTCNFGSTGPRWSKIGDFEPIIARSASAVTSSEKSLINANRKSTMRFPMSLRWLSYVAPKSSKGGPKTQNGRFP